MNRILFLLILLLFNSHRNQAQLSTKDSMSIEELIKKADKLGETDINKSFVLFSKVKEKAKKAGSKYLLAKSLYAESYYFFFDANYQQLIRNVQEASKMYKSLNLKREEAKCYLREGLSWMYLNHYSESLRSNFKSKKLAEEIDDKELIAALNNNIGLVYESLNDWDNALKYAHKALGEKMIIKDTLGMAKSYSNIANLYYYNKKYKLALINFKLAQKFCNLANDAYLQAALDSDFGNILNEMNQPDSAIYYQNKALKLHSQFKDERFTEWCQTVSSLASAWLKKGNLAKTAFYLNECESCEKAIDDFSFLKRLYTFRSEYYTKIKNHEQASHNLQLLNTVNDSILLKSDKFENQRIAILYEFEQKAKEDSLHYELSLSNEKIATATYKNRIYLLLVILLLVSSVAAGIIRRIRKIQERKRKQELEKMRSNIAGDLHDDIGSTLSSIQIISSMMLQQNSDDAKMKESVGNISRLSEKVADGIREIVWSVNPLNDNLEAIVNQLRKLASEALDAVDILFTFNDELADPHKKLLPEVRKDFILFFKELINNAVKYSGSKRIIIQISQKSAYLELNVKDHGCGFDFAEIKRGNGLTNMEKRAANMKAKLTIISKSESGTVVNLKIPLP